MRSSDGRLLRVLVSMLIRRMVYHVPSGTGSDKSAEVALCDAIRRGAESPAPGDEGRLRGLPDAAQTTFVTRSPPVYGPDA